MQESKKTNSWNKMSELPRDAGEFSSFQVDRLLKRRFLQKKIQSVQKEMGQRHIHVQNLDELATYEAEFGTEAQVVGSRDKGALLLKPKLNPTNSIPGTSTDQSGMSRKKNQTGTAEDFYIGVSSASSDEEEPPHTRSHPSLSGVKVSEEEADIQLAIQLSLNQDLSQRDLMEKETREKADQKADESELEKAIQLSLVEREEDS